MRILIIDDEVCSCNLIKNELLKIVPGSEIIAFCLPLDGLKYIKNHACDVVFLDIDMPQMNGIELAKQMKQVQQHVNFIFVTGYAEYCMTAMRERASGYILKPVSKKALEEELNHLRYPVKEGESGIRVKTFGFFEVSVDGKPVHFNRTKSKEMLAYLVDCKGNAVSKKEIAAYLFPDQVYDKNIQDYMKKIVTDLKMVLKESHAEELVHFGYNAYSINVTACTCDLYKYESGSPEAINAFYGEYMKGYEWAQYKIVNRVNMTKHSLKE